MWTHHSIELLELFSTEDWMVLVQVQEEDKLLCQCAAFTVAVAAQWLDASVSMYPHITSQIPPSRKAALMSHSSFFSSPLSRPSLKTARHVNRGKREMQAYRGIRRTDLAQRLRPPRGRPTIARAVVCCPVLDSFHLDHSHSF